MSKCDKCIHWVSKEGLERNKAAIKQYSLAIVAGCQLHIEEKEHCGDFEYIICTKDNDDDHLICKMKLNPDDGTLIHGEYLLRYIKDAIIKHQKTQQQLMLMPWDYPDQPFKITMKSGMRSGVVTDLRNGNTYPLVA